MSASTAPNELPAQSTGWLCAPPAAGVCLVIPTRNEPAPLVIELARQIGEILPGARIVIVDDSDLDWAQSFGGAVNAAMPEVQLLLRSGLPGGRDGLGGAVLAGMRQARLMGCEYAIVMDSDGQHPPTQLPSLLRLLVEDGTDVAIASRYRPGGSVGTGLSFTRRVVSIGSGALAHLVFPVATRSCTDPMSGFFGVRLSELDLQCWANGFKVLLQLLAQHPTLSRAEIGFRFQERQDGRSKASAAEGMRYIKGLAVLRTKTLRWRSSKQGAGRATAASVREKPVLAEKPSLLSTAEVSL